MTRPAFTLKVTIEGKTLFQCLSFFYVSRSHIISLMNLGTYQFYQDDKLLKIDDVVSKGEIKVFINEKIDLYPNNEKIDIAYEDEHYLIVNKKRGDLIHSENSNDTLANKVAGYFQKHHIRRIIRINNRLDIDTEGLVIFSKDLLASSYIDYLIREKKLTKKYYALVHNRFNKKTGEISLPISSDRHNNNKMTVSKNGKKALTRYEVIKNGKMSLVDVTLLTGRTHQIRVHFSYINHPLVGDAIYGQGDGELMLQAYYLSFFQPFLEKMIYVIINLSPDIKRRADDGDR